MRLLTLTTLYPNAAAPAHGIFVENRLRAFLDRHGGAARVIAPVPWFPINAAWAGKYAAFARAPKSEIRRDIEVSHPRYSIPPKIGMSYAARALERCFFRAASDLRGAGYDFDVIDAHYLYPDGVAAVRAARRLGKPVVITARGTDVNYLPRFSRQRAMILEAVRGADAVIAVAQALRDELVQLGAPAEKIRVLRNGVDLERFRPLDREAARARLGVSGKVIASVGHLTERKGHHLVIEAMSQIPDAVLLIAGAGEEEGALYSLAERLGVSGRVRFLGAVAHEKLADIYNAADVLALASSREGWPNVLLESMACGTQVVASPVWGSVEVVTSPEAGRLAAARTGEAMADALQAALAHPPRREDTRGFAANFSWDETSDGLAEIFEDVAGRARAKSAVTYRPAKPVKPERPQLIVTVDTEEQFDWSRFEPDGYTIADPADIERFQTLAASFGVKPLYLLTYPMIADAANRNYFAALHHAGAADLGLHLHQWVTPPIGGYTGAYYSYQCNLPRDLHRAKLETLADAFEAAFGFRARAHRAGRYGISQDSYEALASVGIGYDFSPSVAFDASAEGGPDFSSMANAPFTVESPAHDRVRVIPLCGVRALRGVKLFLPQDRAPGLPPPRRNRFSRIAWPQRLTCEGSSLGGLKRLTRRLENDCVPILTFSLHSTTMTAGATAYACDEAAVAAQLDLCADYFRFFQSEIGGAFLSVESLAASYNFCS